MSNVMQASKSHTTTTTNQSLPALRLRPVASQKLSEPCDAPKKNVRVQVHTKQKRQTHKLYKTTRKWNIRKT
jgi:Tfp pilus assembly ATPase PilU